MSQKRHAHRFLVLMLLMFLPVFEVMSKQDYTYVKASLNFPWFMFFVFLTLILIPFVLVIILSWRSSGAKNEQQNSISSELSVQSAGQQSNKFNRVVLPAVLLVVMFLTILFVLNAFEAMDLMQHSGTASPTMLNVRP